MSQKRNTMKNNKINTINMIKLIKMINLYGFMRVMNNTEYYHRKWDGECTKRYRIR